MFPEHGLGGRVAVLLVNVFVDVVGVVVDVADVGGVLRGVLVVEAGLAAWNERDSVL